MHMFYLYIYVTMVLFARITLISINKVDHYFHSKHLEFARC